MLSADSLLKAQYILIDLLPLGASQNNNKRQICLPGANNSRSKE